MKKNFFVLMAIALIFAACDGKKTPNAVDSEVTNLTLDPAALTFVIGDAPQKITATTEPAGATVTWETSDEAVATVRAGVVTPLTVGECVITAKAGNKTATCQVTVKDETDEPEFIVGGFSTWRIGEVVEGLEADTFDVELSDGTYKCQIHNSTLYIWDNGVSLQTVDNKTSITGAGYVTICPGYVYVIAEGTYAGYYVSEWYARVSEGVTVPFIAPGYVDENFAPSVVNLYNLTDASTDDEIAAAQEAFYGSIKGSYGFYWDIVNNKQYIPEYVLTDGIVATNSNDEVLYDITLDWFAYGDNAYSGVKGQSVEVDGKNEFVFSEPLETVFLTERYQNYDFSSEEVSKRDRKLVSLKDAQREPLTIDSKNISVKTFRMKK